MSRTRSLCACGAPVRNASGRCRSCRSLPLAVPAIDAAWAAGFFDGEGHVGIGRIRDRRLEGGFRDLRLQPRLVIGCTSRPPLDKWLRLFDGSLRQRSPQVANRKAVWVWSVSGALASQRVAEVIRPYLLVKGDELDLMLELCHRLAAWKQGQRLTNAEMVARNDIAARLAACASRSGTGRGLAASIPIR